MLNEYDKKESMQTASIMELSDKKFILYCNMDEDMQKVVP